VANTRGIRAGKAYVELSADDNKLVRGLRDAQRRLRSFGRMITGIGAGILGSATAIVAPFKMAADSFADFGDQVHKASIRMGLSADHVSALGFAAEQSGSNIEAVEAGFRGMARTLYNAEQGLTTATDALTSLGLSVEDFHSLDPIGQFRLLAERISQIEDPTEKAAIAMRVFGRSGQQLIPLLNEGASGIAALEKEAAALGITLTDSDAAAAAALTDAMNRLKRAMAAAWINGGKVIVDGLTQFYNATAKSAATIGRFVVAHQDSIRVALMATAAVAGFGGTLLTLGVAVQAVAFAMGGFAAAIGFVGTVAGLLITPMGATLSLLAALATWAIKSGAATEWLASRFGPLVDNGREAIGAIAKAMTEGNIEAAANVMWAAMDYAWQKGTQSLRGLWDDFVAGMLMTWNDAVGEIAKGLAYITGNKDLTAEIDKITGEVESQIIDNRIAKDTASQKRLDDARRRYNDAVAEANSGSAASGNSSSVARVMDLINSLSASGGVPSISAAAPTSGTFSSLSSRMFLGERITPGEQAIVSELQKVNQNLQDEVLLP